jgi:hypothetical protein
LYALTDAGRRAVEATFDVSVSPTSPAINWRLYSWVVRARIRKRVLLGMALWEAHSPDGLTASHIRRYIRADYPVGLNPVIRAVRELADKKLVTCIGTTDVRGCKLYRLSPTGRHIVGLMVQ